jgi:hypothetical protein
MVEGSGCGAEDSLEPEWGNTLLGWQRYRKFLPWIGCQESGIKNSASRPLAQVLGNRPVCPQFLPAPAREELDLRNGPQADMAS